MPMFTDNTILTSSNAPMMTAQVNIYLQVHLNKLECRGKVHLFQ